MSEENKSVIMPVGVFNSITEYLSSRPYREVNQIIEEIRSTTQLVDVPQAEETQDAEGE